MVAYNHQRLEPETPSALDYTGYPVYKNYSFVKGFFFFHLKLQSAGSCRVCQLFNPAVVFTLAAVKNYLLNFSLLSFLGNLCACPSGFIRKRNCLRLPNGSGISQRAAVVIIDNLGADLTIADMDTQPRAFGCAMQTPARSATTLHHFISLVR
jgi:hypothetical protein